LAKNRMTFEKQLRETKKKQKAAAKRADRQRNKSAKSLERLPDQRRDDSDALSSQA
jgi:hypothetical protein